MVAKTRIAPHDREQGQDVSRLPVQVKRPRQRVAHRLNHLCECGHKRYAHFMWGVTNGYAYSDQFPAKMAFLCDRIDEFANVNGCRFVPCDCRHWRKAPYLTELYIKNEMKVIAPVYPYDESITVDYT